jgi:hypothetical protein
MIHDINGGATDVGSVVAGKTKDEKKKNLYGATVVCRNATGTQLYDLHIHIKGLTANTQKPAVTVQGLDKGKPTGPSWPSDPNKTTPPNPTGESDVDVDPVNIDPDGTFNITVSHESPSASETKYTLTITPTDSNGFPIN